MVCFLLKSGTLFYFFKVLDVPQDMHIDVKPRTAFGWPAPRQCVRRRFFFFVFFEERKEHSEVRCEAVCGCFFCLWFLYVKDSQYSSYIEHVPAYITFSYIFQAFLKRRVLCFCWFVALPMRFFQSAPVFRGQ